MRVLLLSANTGGGHNSAAMALKAQFEAEGVFCEMRDALSFVSEIHSDIISNGHTYIYRHFPQLFGVGYRFEERHPPRFLYDQMALGVKRFMAFWKENPFDAVVSTHLFGSMLMTEVRKRYELAIPHYFVITDYALYPGVDMVDVQRYFVPSSELFPLFEEAGISSDRLAASGIPIRAGFKNTIDKKQARVDLHLPETGQIVLLFSGSIGCGHLHRVAPVLEKSLPDDAYLVIVCGHNKRAYEQLSQRCGARTVIVGYTDRIAEYMAAADLCITKPGGLSITEMLVMELPMILMLSVPGCESRNLSFFEERGLAIGTDNWFYVTDIMTRLLDDRAAISEMKENMRRLGYPGGAPFIVRKVMEDCSDNQ